MKFQIQLYCEQIIINHQSSPIRYSGCFTGKGGGMGGPLEGRENV